MKPMLRLCTALAAASSLAAAAAVAPGALRPAFDSLFPLVEMLVVLRDGHGARPPATPEPTRSDP